MWDSIPGPGDHDLSRRQTLHRLSHPGTPQTSFLMGTCVELWVQTATTIPCTGAAHAEVRILMDISDIGVAFSPCDLTSSKTPRLHVTFSLVSPSIGFIICAIRVVTVVTTNQS